MNCEELCDRIADTKSGTLPELGQRQLAAHLQSCEDCRHALRALEALQELKTLEVTEAPPELIERVMHNSVRVPVTEKARPGFWAGAGFGGALAASLVLAIMALGSGADPDRVTGEPIYLSLSEPRDLHVAIDLERDLPEATITVVLKGGIALAGYQNERELSWKTDLQAGVNKLTLPVLAVNEQGGQLLVQVDHDTRRRTFRIDLDTAS
ncbi:MAG: hypothetical protein WD448_09090 [Woeseia sp.]